MNDRYEHPLCTRYASKEMQKIFSADEKFSTWRKLWTALAECEKELGLEITEEQISQMKQHLYDINYETAKQKEKELRHDVMAHIHAFGEQCPLAKPIIHLGATSCFVGDNTDIILMKNALERIKMLLLNVMEGLVSFAEKYKDLPTLGYTHFQAAQPTTVGKRATLWLQDLLIDFQQIQFAMSQIKPLGCRGATGTGASFLELFEGDREKVLQLERMVSRKIGFDDTFAVSGQTYTRKLDYIVASTLSSIAQSAYKFSSDVRLLSHLKEVDEPFEEQQVGSSAMAYKRNPMRCERIAALSRYVIVDALNPALTASSQWMERTLDDSANKRMSIPESFLATDGILSLYYNVISGMKVYPNTIKKHLDEELPFMATENILMYCVKKGGDRQALHEAIRKHSVATAKAVKEHAQENDLITRILADATFGLTEEDIDEIMDYKKFVGMATEQTETFLLRVKTVLAENRSLLGTNVEINV